MVQDLGLGMPIICGAALDYDVGRYGLLEEGLSGMELATPSCSLLGGRGDRCLTRGEG